MTESYFDEFDQAISLPACIAPTKSVTDVYQGLLIVPRLLRMTERCFNAI